MWMQRDDSRDGARIVRWIHNKVLLEKREMLVSETKHGKERVQLILQDHPPPLQRQVVHAEAEGLLKIIPEEKRVS